MKNIILVEDNKIERRNISNMLEKIKECKLVGVFFNGEDALNFLEENNVDIIITDVQMPYMDGIELSKMVRQKGWDTEIIIISGYQDFDNAKRAVGLDIIDYVLKPIINNELETAIYTAISKNEEKKLKKVEYENMNEKIESSKSILKEKFIRELVINPRVSDDYIKSNEEFLMIDVSNGYKRLIVMKISDIQEKNTLKVIWEAIKYIEEYDKEGVRFFPFMSTEDEIVVAAVGSDPELITYSCIELKNKIISIFDLQISMCISSQEKRVNRISSLYGECKETLKEAGNKLNIVQFSRKDICLFAEYQRNACQIVKAIDIKKLSDYLVEILAKRVDEKGKIDKPFSYMYVNLIEQILCEVSAIFDDFEIFSSQEIWTKLGNFESIINIENFLSNLAKSSIEFVREFGNSNLRVVKDVKKFIHEHYAERITVSDIAGEVNFSRKQIHRIFTRETGMTIIEYLTEYRIELAKKLLLENRAVDDVMFEVGYKDKKYFYEVFKEKTGITPKQFKEENKK